MSGSSLKRQGHAAMPTSESERSAPAEDETDPQEVTLLSDETTPPLMEKLQIEESDDTESKFAFEIDSPGAWLIAVTCSWIMFWTLLINRSSSLMYISLKQELNMTSAESAAPMSMLGAVSNLFAIVSGFAIRKLPLPLVSMLGTILTSLGILLAGAFYNKFAITYGIGVISAIGQSLIFPANMVAVNTYFKKNRTTASGVSYIGGTLVSFLLPFGYQALEKEFTHRYTLLILGSLTLLALFGAIVLRYPAKNPEPENNNVTIKKVSEKEAKSIRQERNSSFLEKFGFMKRPIFYLIVLTGIVFAYHLVLFNVTVVRFALEKQMETQNALLTLWYYAGGDAIGRLFSGQLSDRGYLRRRTIMSLTFFLSSIAFFGLAFAAYKVVYFGLCFLYGLAAGSTMILFSVILTEYLGLDNLPLALGVHCLLNGLAALPRQRLLGLLKSESSSHVSVYLFLAVVSVITSLCWGIHCLYLNIQEHRKNSRERRASSKDDTQDIKQA